VPTASELLPSIDLLVCPNSDDDGLRDVEYSVEYKGLDFPREGLVSTNPPFLPLEGLL
jgi:hypothetical protein